MAPDPTGRKPERSSFAGAADYMGLGIQFVAVLLAFLFAGQWLDEKLGTKPWLLILGVFLGFILSVLYMVLRLNEGNRKKGDGK